MRNLVLYLPLCILLYRFKVSYCLENGNDLILCRKCGADVADSSYLFDKISPGARKIQKQNIYGRKNITVQTLVNPYGVNFEIITAEKSRCENFGHKHGADSWFPGYTWRICSCAQCGHHLGWSFERNAEEHAIDKNLQTFYGLILDNILEENFTDSLIVMPKMYEL